MDIRSFFGSSSSTSSSKPPVVTTTTTTPKKDDTHDDNVDKNNNIVVKPLPKEEESSKENETVLVVQSSPIKKPKLTKVEENHDDNNNNNNNVNNNVNNMNDNHNSDNVASSSSSSSSAPSPNKNNTTATTNKNNNNNDNNNVKKRKSPPSSNKKKSPLKKSKTLLKPTTTHPTKYYSTSNKHNNTLVFTNLTFVITGVIPSISREDLTDYIKILGGRVTTAVSTKTDYLIIGKKLEDERDVTDGSKFKKAMELGEDSICILNGDEEVYALAKMIDERNNNNNNQEEEEEEDKEEEKESIKVEGSSIVQSNPYARKSTTTTTTTSSTSSSISNPYAKNTNYNNTSSASSMANPYAKKSSSASNVSNPYAKKSSSSSVSNPYAKASSSSTTTTAATVTSNPYNKSSSSTPTTSNNNMGGGRANVSDPNALWADKYAPSHTGMILGNGDSVRKLKQWLSSWENDFLKPLPKGKKRPFNPKTGPFKAALLSGPPGIGKTTTAVLVATEANRQVLELNASDTRSKKSLETNLGDVTGSHVISFNQKGPSSSSKSVKKRCIIMDEVDGMGAGDRSGMSELIKMIKNSMVPIICICNDRQSQKIKSLVPHCLDLKYRRPVKSVIAKRAIDIGNAEGMNIEPNAAEALAESCGNDIRQVLNCLQMWSNKRVKGSNKMVNMTYKDFKDRDNLVNKDEILRVSLFDATRMLVEGRRGLNKEMDAVAQKNHLFNRTDAFHVDYSLMGLMVHQNYLKVALQKFQQTKVKSDISGELQCLNDMFAGTQSMSDFGLVEHSMRGDQNWGLLPLCAVLATKTGFHAGGESGGLLTGFPEFSGWLGKNSSRGKKSRIIQEFSHHMNYKISADNTELRLGYLPVIRSNLSKLLMSKEDCKISEAIEFMDEYGLDRDDVFENLDEFVMDRNVKKFSDLDSKVKAAFTREYNKGIHKSQALVDEQGVSTKRKRAATNEGEPGEENDEFERSDSEEEEMNIDELKKMFKKTKKSSAKSGSKKTKK